jgi:fumarate reductase subunit C
MPLNELHFILFMAETFIRRVPDVLVVNVHNKKVKKSK